MGCPCMVTARIRVIRLMRTYGDSYRTHQNQSDSGPAIFGGEHLASYTTTRERLIEIVRTLSTKHV